MGQIVKRMGHFNIIKEDSKEHIVHNTKFPFKKAHTHQIITIHRRGMHDVVNRGDMFTIHP